MLLDQLHVQAWRLRSKPQAQGVCSLPEHVVLAPVTISEPTASGTLAAPALGLGDQIATVESVATPPPQSVARVPTIAPVMLAPEPTQPAPPIHEEVVPIVAESVATDPVAIADWARLQSMTNTGLLCPSCNTNNSVLGHGSQQAEWLFVFDSPTSTDLREGQICNGRAGSLYEALLSVCGMDRAKVYTTTVFKCAPTDDLRLSPACHDILRRQIELIEPKVVVAFGEFAAQSVLKANEPLDALRQQARTCFSTGVRVVPTYSPLQMLEHNELKAEVWRDLSTALRWYRQPQ